MKKLISLIFVALIASQMWGVNVTSYVKYGYQSSGKGKIYIKIKSGAMTSLPSSTDSGWKTTNTSASGNSTYNACFAALANTNYEFIGWYDGDGANATLVSAKNPYWVSNSTGPTVYARFVSATDYTVSSKAYKMAKVDMGTADNILWGDRAIGATSKTEAGFFCQYGYTTLSSSNYCSSSNSYSGGFTSSGNLPADNDVATAALGEGWRMPTQTEWNNLISKSTFKCEDNGGNNVELTANKIVIILYTADKKYNGSAAQATSTSSYAYYWTGTRETGTDAYRAKFSKNTNVNNMTKGTDDLWWVNGLQVIPVYDESDYTLTISNNIDNTTETYTNKWGHAQSVTPPTISGYKFKKWGDNNSTTANRTIKICDITYQAIYEEDGYTITYNKGSYGTGNAIPNGTKTKDVEFTLSSSTYSRTGYTQTGWSTSSNGSTNDYALGGKYNTNADLSLYPYWTAKTYTATNNINGNGGNNGTYTATYDATSLTINTAPTREGHTLEGLYKEAGCTNKIANASGSLIANTAYTNSSSKWTNDGNVTLYAKWTANNYSVTFKAADGTTTLQGPTNYSYGATITSCPIPVQQSGNTVFAGWTLNGNTSVVYTYEQIYNAMTVTGDMVFTAKYVPALSVTIPAFTNNGKVLVTANGTTYNVTSDGDEIYVANGSNVTIQAVPNAYYHFAAWKEDDQADDFIEYRPLNASVTYTPTWEQNVALPLVDTENEAYYTALYSNATYAGKMLTVTMTGRRLTAGSWMTFCAPFEFDIPAGHALDGAVYRFINGTMTGTNTEGYISLDFVRTHKIEANVPYLVVAKTTTDTDLEFDGVTIEDAPEQKPVKASSGDVQFVSQPWKDALVNEALELADFYIASGNTLRYAKVGDPGTTIRAFRAYFHRLRDLNATPAPRRIVISLDGVETTKEIGVDGEIEDTTRKYMENGILYIERNGVRYDAQGQRAE